MKNILVALDYSFASINAAKYAAELALDIEAGIILFNVYPGPAAYAQLPGFLTIEETHQNAAFKIEAVKYELNTLTNGKLTILTLLKTGSFFEVLKKACEEIDPDLVIIGCQGTTASERLVLGGHSVYSMTHLNWPLITVPARASYNKIRKIALACDLKDTIASVPIRCISKLVNTLHARLHIVHACKMGKPETESFNQWQILHKAMGVLKPAIHLITVENIDEGIMGFAEENEIDLLIVLPKRDDLLHTLFHGSDTKQFVLHSHLPVLALHC